MDRLRSSIKCVASAFPREWLATLTLVIIAITTIWIAQWAYNLGNERSLEFDISSHETEPDAERQASLKSNDYIQAFAPADGRPLCSPTSLPAASKESIDDAINKASLAQQGWSKTTLSQRRRVLKTLLKHIIDHQNELVEACCLDSGKTKVDASFGEILVTCEKLQWTITHGEKALRPSRRPTNLLMLYKHNTVVYEPLGVVAAAVSWNYPFHNFISPIISAIFAGNSIVVKPSEQTCWSATYFTRLVQGAIARCGHSPNIVQSVVCLPELGDYFTSRRAFKHITFIGSREVAYKVCASAATALTPVTVELGGKDPAIVLDDKRTINDIERVVSILLRGVFQSAGQNCIGIERIIALPGVYDKIITNVILFITSLRLGNALHDEDSQYDVANNGTQFDDNNAPDVLSPRHVDVGAQISDRNFAKLESLIQAAVSGGARLLSGGYRYEHRRYPGGNFFAPTLLVDVTVDMEIAQEELFAPIFLLMKAKDVNEAVSIANSTSYSLGASIFGYDGFGTGYPKGTISSIVHDINAGMVSINDFATYYMCSMPFGGCGKTKGSGYGRFGGEEGLRALSNIKAICDDAPWAKLLGISTTIPPPLQYPISDGKTAWKLCQGIVETGYAVTIKGRLGGLQKILEALWPTKEKTRN